ncbi:PGF-CTERM-anchored ABC transporter substrate-binding protein [Halorarum halophilum]|uniref:PGF-CTERM-anchored ABC transporter substrate-binding protein n=1 Tax=Halorarum halophilum TaxID=2743090 RepID=UPI001FE24678|nr:PGF-CTERM-anchored ABC transporter substrate-binding protein [Halobaculum halophilum]
MRRYTAILLATALVLSGAVPAVAAGASAPTASDGVAGVDAPAVGGDARAVDGQFRTNGQAASCEFPFTATDATGTEVTLEERPERVTTLNPSAAQTMWEIGGKEQVVGLTQYALYLDGADSRTNVSASGMGVSVEAVVGTNPDLVLAPNASSPETVSALREAGVTVFHFAEATNVTDVRTKTTLIGQLTGNCRGAAEANAWMDANVEAAGTATADAERPTALYPLGGGYVANTGTFISAMIEAAGAENAAGQREFSTTYPQVSDEVVLELSPDYLVLTDSTTYLTEQEPYASLDAVRENNTVMVETNYLNQPAPRSVVYAVRNLTEGFHPEAAANAEFVARSEVSVETASSTASPTPDGETGDATAEPTEEPTTTDTTAAGFGAAVATLALLASALLARRGR